MPHPASLLVVWLGFALGLQWLPVSWLLAVAFASVVATACIATERGIGLLRRSRWLLLSLLILYLFVTPGERLPGYWGDIGLTYEGLWQGGEQIARLLAMLASLALLHQAVGTRGLVAGIYWLLRPLPWRELTVVRLMLVLEFVEQKKQIRWRDWLSPEPCSEGTVPQPTYVLVLPSLQLRDKLLISGVLAFFLLMVFRA
jgi:hypothetical protein